MLEQLIEKCRAAVFRDGFYVQFVGGDEDAPAYSYSVGLEKNLQHPEIIMVGFDPRLCHQLISDAVANIREGERYDRPRYADRIVQDFNVAFRPLSSESVHANTGFGQTVIEESFEAVQMYLPDAQGRFPWDEGCDRNYAEMQTQIFEVEGDPPSMQITASDPEGPGV